MANMTFQEVRTAIRELSKSQGFYGRLDRALDECHALDPLRYDDIRNELEGKYKDVVDMIMDLEGGR